MLEVRGREIRTSPVDEQSKGFEVHPVTSRGGIMLKSGQQLFVACDSYLHKSNSQKIYCNYKELPKLVKPNDVLYIDDGKIVCLVTDVEQVRRDYGGD